VLRIRGTSRILAVLGDPIAHSLSPEMHNAAIAGLGLDAVFIPLRVAPAALPVALDGCAALGIGGNLTVPLKQTAAARIPNLTPLALTLGAVNTFWIADGALHGDNTDVAGLDETLAALGAEPPWLVVGAGGSARAVAAVAARRRVPLLVRSRAIPSSSRTTRARSAP
jgi:shikimate dehydrogenase